MAEEGHSGLEKATDLLNSGQIAEALEVSRTILVGEPGNINAKLIEAIALSQLGNVSDASEAFAQAIELDPNNAKAYYNSAIHEFNAGHTALARRMADEALNADPNYEGPRALLERIGPAPAGNSMSNYERVSQESLETPYEALPMVTKMGKWWSVLGWVLAGISLLFFLHEMLGLMQHWSEMNEAVAKQDMGKIQTLSRSVSPMIYQMFGIIVRMASVFWVVLDILHRRSSFYWLIGHIPCSCLGFSFITQPLYMLLGRK